MKISDKNLTISQVSLLAAECSRSGWDGADAAPKDRGAVARAGDLIRALPEGIPLPEVAPEPDGCISLDWIQAPERLFSLSVGANRRLAYAWLDGAEKGHAAVVFDGQKVPRTILQGIKRIMDATAPEC